ncbi:alpha/beta hydrolase [Bacillus sinesaloumensis]|uniref:alpha/beta hydrolase n=1 Tax=Litchfieldia sinesaloumensis TaxID=1926280 RepID=UPI0009884815|nr:esterase family protein [Bacillus sinesaloumensis]
MTVNKGTVREMTIHSKILNEELELIVYLPATFSPLYKYNVLIAQDGRDYFNLGRVARVADSLLESKEIANTIIVGVPYKSVADRRRKYHPEGEQFPLYKRFLGEELVPFLDQEFPTYQMGQGRALIGDSLAATISLLTALEYPHTFGKVIMQSPLVNNHVLRQVEKFEEPHLLDLYHVIGTGETEVKTTKGEVEDFLTPNRELHKIISNKGYPYFYEEFNGNHTWTHWQPDLPRALSKMLK